MAQMLQPSIILLREGTDTSQGKPQLISNINACQAIVDTVRTTLGPRGMDKLIYTDGQGRVVISNDGATIMKQLDIVHPAAQTLVAIAKSQDSEVGDGTTSVVVLAGELLKESKQFIEEGVHPQVVIRGLQTSCNLARERLRALAVKIDANPEEKRRVLLKCAGTALNSKLVATHKEQFSAMVVDAVLHLDDDLDLSMIGIKKEGGGSLEESVLVEGVAFKKTFSYAGFEQAPKKFENPKILALNLELELKAERDNAELRIATAADYQAMVDAEWDIIYEKLQRIVDSGAKVVLSRLAIGDLATQFFADRNVFCAGRVPEDDLRRICRSTGAQVQTTVNDLLPSVLGTCDLFEERQVGAERYNFFTGTTSGPSVTLLLRGGGEQFNDEAERSLHDAIMIVRRAIRHSQVVAGGGAIEMNISRYLRRRSREMQGKQQQVVNAFAKALEIIPRQLSTNAGFDATDILNKLRQRHAAHGAGPNPDAACWFGVDVVNEDICDTFESGVWEPALVKLNSITAATEAACLILSVDETVRNPKSSNPADSMPAPAPRGGMPRGRGMRR